MAISGSYVSFSGFTLLNWDNGMQISGTFIKVDQMKIHGGNGIGFDMTTSVADSLITNVEVSHYYRRKHETDSWLNYGGGTGFNVKGVRNTLRNITGWNCWNVFSGTMSYTLVEDAFIKNSPNHTFIMSSNGMDDDCHDNVIKRSAAFNGQDQFFIRGCRNTVFIRNQGDIFLDDGAVTNNLNSPNWKIRSNNLKRIYIGTLSASGFTSNYNWLDSVSGNLCRKADDIRNCAGPWQQFGYDLQSNYGTVRMASSPWPRPPATGPPKWRSDFIPGQELGDDATATPTSRRRRRPGDRIRRNDECTAAHYCSGSRPDIGPTSSAGHAAAPGEIRRHLRTCSARIRGSADAPPLDKPCCPPESARGWPSTVLRSASSCRS